MMQAIDLWLRSVWTFWDTHGTRLLGVAGFLHAAISAVVVALNDLNSDIAAAMLGVSAVLGAMTKARGSTNASRQP